MSYPQSGSDQEQGSAVHEASYLQELTHRNPPSSDLSKQCREPSSTHIMWKKPQYSMNLAAPDTLLDGSAKKRTSGELSCELGLGVWENPRRVCRICHRHFSSGRALGGHMRVHGPLFQPAGTKRKLNYAESQGASKLEDGLCMDVSDSKKSDLSLLSKNLSEEEEVLKFDEVDETIMTSDSEGEAVDDAHTSETYVNHLGRVENDDDAEFDDGHDFYVGGHRGSKQDSTDVAIMASSKRNPLYKLRRNPKKSRRFAEEDFAMEMFLSGQHYFTKGSAFSSLEKPRVCTECGKSFWSWKALFGHMRCHPERDWRGILPPDDVPEARIGFAKKKLFAETRLLESSDYELDSDVENKEFSTEVASYDSKKSVRMAKEEHTSEHNIDGDGIGDQISKENVFGNALEEEDWHRRWPTGKRSRRKLVEGKAESAQDYKFSPQREEPALTSESGSLEAPQEEQHGETPNFLLMLAEAARKIEKETQAQKNHLHMLASESKHYREGHEGGKHEGKAFPAIKAATSSTTGIVKYECATCKKSFNSHQALGGHRASHRKMKGCFARTSDGDDTGSGQYNLIREFWQGDHTHEKDPSLHVVDKDMKQQQFKGHECSICHRVFATGQALGGHKRCHYIGEKVAEAASFTSSNKQIVCEEGHSSRLDTEGGSALDLNMPAPADEDGQVAEVATALQLFSDKHDEKEPKQRRSEELLLAHWARKDLAGDERRSSPWELDSRWAMGPAVAY